MTKPLDIFVRCPKCHEEHIDCENEEKQWWNPPHKTHECQNCGELWRPYPFPTNGVSSVTWAQRLIVWLRSKSVYESHLDGYMNRWWLWRAKDRSRICLRLHEILRSDYGRDKHDHPWTYIALILKNGYWEITLKGKKWHGPGSILIRRATSVHRLVLPEGTTVWTLFLTFPKSREWGFVTKNGWVRWQDYEGTPEQAAILKEQKCRTD